MKSILVLIMVMLCSSSASAEEVWLVVAASDRSPAGIAVKSKRVGRGTGIIVQNRDCGDKNNVFALASNVESSARAAEESLKIAKKQTSDAYIKKCVVRPGSLLAFRESAVDLSIADVPPTAVNWEDSDRISTIQPLKGGWHVLISRYYNGSIDDVLEGKRERVTLIRQGGVRSLLQDRCVTPEKFTADKRIVAFQCTAEQAGDELFHTVHVFSLQGKKIDDITHCRNPGVTAKGTVVCESETIAADGILRLRQVEHALSAHQEEVEEPQLDMPRPPHTPLLFTRTNGRGKQTLKVRYVDPRIISFRLEKSGACSRQERGTATIKPYWWLGAETDENEAGGMIPVQEFVFTKSDKCMIYVRIDESEWKQATVKESSQCSNGCPVVEEAMRGEK